MKRQQTGFTLIELMIAVAIVSILAAIAVPAYFKHITRGRMTEAFTGLSGAQIAAEQFWANNRTYDGFKASSSWPKDTEYFAYSLDGGAATASAYKIIAKGKDTGSMKGFEYWIDQSGNRGTTNTPDLGTNDTCWVDKSGGKCSN